MYIYYLNTILDEKQPLHRSSSPIINYVLEEKFKIPRGKLRMDRQYNGQKVKGENHKATHNDLQNTTQKT